MNNVEKRRRLLNKLEKEMPLNPTEQKKNKEKREMSFYQKNKKEIQTLHLLSQIVGKVKLEYAVQEPQWAHIILDITPRGFSTGLLIADKVPFEITVDLIKHVIVIQTKEAEAEIQLKNGRSIQTYYRTLMDEAKRVGVPLSIQTNPQEMDWNVPFEEDTHHHHYDEAVAHEMLQWFQFAWDVEQHFIGPLRQRKVYPGLFWGTFDVSCILVYNELAPFSDDSKVIERAAFDEYMIEFGFWLGDAQFDHPTFFTLPYPFVEGVALETDATFPEGSYFSLDMAEYLYEMKQGRTEAEKKNVRHFIEASCIKSMEYLKWTHTDHYFEELKMEENKKTL